jgi:hypothetical protein
LGFFCAQKLRPSLLESEAKGAKTASAPCGALELSGIENSPCPGIVAVDIGRSLKEGAELFTCNAMTFTCPLLQNLPP